MSPLQIQLQAVLDRYVAAYIAKDAAGCAAVFMPDGVVYSSYGPPALGRDAIAAQHREWVNYGGKNKSLLIQDMGGHGDTAWCLARYSEGEVKGSGMSLMVFARSPSGDWLVLKCSMTELD